MEHTEAVKKEKELAHKALLARRQFVLDTFLKCQALALDNDQALNLTALVLDTVQLSEYDTVLEKAF